MNSPSSLLPQTKTRILPQSPQQANETEITQKLNSISTPQILLHFDMAVKVPQKVRINEPETPVPSPATVATPEFISIQTRKINETPLAEKIAEWQKELPEDLAKIKLNDTLLYLRHSLEKLNAQKITHGDLTIKNIVYDNINHCPIVRNFQLSFQYEPPPPPQPPQHPPYNPHFKHICFDAQVINFLLDHPEKQEITTAELQKLANQAAQPIHAQTAIQSWNPSNTPAIASTELWKKAVQTAPLWDLYSIYTSMSNPANNLNQEKS